MNASIVVQLPRPHPSDSLEAFIEKVASEAAWATLSVAVAYSSVAGARALYEIVRSRLPKAAFRWLLGLDDYITQPGAVDFCAALPNAQLRVYSSQGTQSRFHPKLFLFESPAAASMIIGSANLTAAALRNNCEAVVRVDTTTSAGRAYVGARFDSLWRLARRPTDAMLLDYAAGYRKYRKSRAFLIESDAAEGRTARSGEVLSSDAAKIDPSIAKVCWIEVGKNTAMGRELEFKAEQALFFGLAPTGGVAERRDFKVSNGESVSLRLKYQRNSMWRLQMSTNIPEVAAGLRPRRNGKLQRSPFVAVFERRLGDDGFRLSFVRVSSRDYSRIRAASEEHGTIGTTSAREYGWY